MLRLRAELLRRARQFLAEQGYLEVETPILSTDVTVDAHLEPFRTAFLAEPNGVARPLFLQTSPEFGMKRLLTAGSGSIYQITRAFRNGDVGAFHNPEFTMIEWYRVGGHYHDLMTEVSQLVDLLVGPRQSDLSSAGIVRLTYQDAFLQHAGFDPFLAGDGEIETVARRFGCHHDAMDRDGLLNYLLGTVVAPKLGFDRPTFLMDYPVAQAALARIRPGTPAVSERFELYVQGIELCNGYQELTDPDELLHRTRRQNELRRCNGTAELPIYSRLIDAMRIGLPECTGVALGFDRVVMLAAGATNLADVMPFTLSNA